MTHLPAAVDGTAEAHVGTEVLVVRVELVELACGSLSSTYIY